MQNTARTAGREWVRAMTKAEAIKDIESNIIPVVGGKSLQMAIDALKAEPHWIPCSERLPEENDDYWVTADPRYVPPNYKSTDIVSWYDGKWLMADYFVLDGEKRKMPTYKVIEVNVPIIAWMPLPKPYGGESDG